MTWSHELVVWKKHILSFIHIFYGHNHRHLSIPGTCRNEPELDWSQTDAGSIGLTPNTFWPITTCWLVICTCLCYVVVSVLLSTCPVCLWLCYLHPTLLLYVTIHLLPLIHTLHIRWPILMSVYSQVLLFLSFIFLCYFLWAMIWMMCQDWHFLKFTHRSFFIVIKIMKFILVFGSCNSNLVITMPADVLTPTVNLLV